MFLAHHFPLFAFISNTCSTFSTNIPPSPINGVINLFHYPPHPTNFLPLIYYTTYYYKPHSPYHHQTQSFEFGKRCRLLAAQLGRESLPHEPIDT